MARIIIGFYLFSIVLQFSCLAQMTNNRSQRMSLNITMASDSLHLLDSLIHKNVKPFELYQVLERSGAIKKILDSIGDKASSPEAVLFLNGSRDTDEFCLLDETTHEQTGYCVDISTIAIVWLDNSPDNRYQISVSVDKPQPSYLQDINTLSGIVGTMLSTKSLAFGFAQESPPPPYTLTAELIKLSSPSQVTISFKKLSQAPNIDSAFAYGNFENLISVSEKKLYFLNKTNVIIHNYDKQYVGICVGLSTVTINSRSFAPNLSTPSLENVVRNSNKQWETSPMLLFYFRPGRESIWEPPWQFWRGEFFKSFVRRLSFMTGFQLHNQPFDRIFAGIGLSLTSTVDLVGGLVALNAPDQSQKVPSKSATDIQNVSKKYESQWFIGFTVTPAFFGQLITGK